MNYAMIFYLLGWILKFEAIFLVLPALTALIYRESEGFAFLITIGICLVIGFALAFRKPKNTTIYAKEGFVMVAMSWIVLSLFGSVPFMISGCIPSFVDALFETVSGFTTTGSSIITDVEALPKCVLIWRSFTHWIGGMGVLVFILAFLPLSGAQNMNLMRAESPGPSVTKLVPKVKSTALLLYGMYSALTVVLFIFLLAGGNSIFDSVNITFATAGTGGFGLKNDSLASYSDYTQIVVTVFMLLFGLNFNAYFFIVTGKFKELFKMSELKGYIGIVVAAIAIITINISSMFETTGEALKHASFTVATLMSTTGFMSTDFNLWPELSRTVIVLLILIGACAGSTAGGIKVSRIIILFKSLGKEIKLLVHPNHVKQINMDGHKLEHNVVRATNVFIVSYLLLFVVSVIIIAFENHDLVTNFTAVATALSNVGPGLNKVGPASNFAFLSDVSKLTLTFDMLAGRLEFFPMFILFSPSTWKK